MSSMKASAHAAAQRANRPQTWFAQRPQTVVNDHFKMDQTTMCTVILFSAGVSMKTLTGSLLLVASVSLVAAGCAGDDADEVTSTDDALMSCNGFHHNPEHHRGHHHRRHHHHHTGGSTGAG